MAPYYGMRRAQVVHHELVDREVRVPLLEAHGDLGVSRGQPRLHAHVACACAWACEWARACACACACA